MDGFFVAKFKVDKKRAKVKDENGSEGVDVVRVDEDFLGNVDGKTEGDTATTKFDEDEDRPYLEGKLSFCS